MLEAITQLHALGFYIVNYEEGYSGSLLSQEMDIWLKYVYTVAVSESGRRIQHPSDIITQKRHTPSQIVAKYTPKYWMHVIRCQQMTPSI